MAPRYNLYRTGGSGFGLNCELYSVPIFYAYLHERLAEEQDSVIRKISSSSSSESTTNDIRVALQDFSENLAAPMRKIGAARSKAEGIDFSELCTSCPCYGIRNTDLVWRTRNFLVEQWKLKERRGENVWWFR